MGALQTSKRRNIQMVVVIMAYKNDINWWEVFKSYSRRGDPFRPDETKRAGPL